MFRKLGAITLATLIILSGASVGARAEEDVDWKKDELLFITQMNKDVKVVVNEGLDTITVDTKHDLNNVIIVSGQGRHLSEDFVKSGKSELKLSVPLESSKDVLMAFEAYEMFADVPVKMQGREDVSQSKLFFNVSRYMKPSQKFQYKLYANDKLIMEYGESSDLYRSVKLVELSAKPDIETGDIIRLEVSKEDYDFPLPYTLKVNNGSSQVEMEANAEGVYEFTAAGNLDILLYEKDFDERDIKIRASLDENGYLLNPHTMEEMKDDVQTETPGVEGGEKPGIEEGVSNGGSSWLPIVGMVAVIGLGTVGVIYLAKRKLNDV